MLKKEGTEYMKALLVIDTQEGIVGFKDFKNEINSIEILIKDFKRQGLPVIFIQHFDDNKEDVLHQSKETSAIYRGLGKYVDRLVVKNTPSAFYKTNLEEILKELGVDHVFISGFNAEFCCMFTTVAAFDRGYKVTFLEDAVGTTSDAETYEITGLDVKAFIATAIDWTGVIEVLDMKAYHQIYKR